MAMRTHFSSIVFGALLLHWLLSATAAAKGDEIANPDLGGEARAIFQAKCGQCHGPNVAKPKGKLGYLLDLKRVASNPKLLLPGKPDESKLWREIASGDMPPEDAKAGPLSNPQKALVRWWIEAGAPEAKHEPSSAQAQATAPALALPAHILQWIGRFHVLVIHFPIALLVGAGVAEVWWMWRRQSGINPAVRYCVLLGACGAIVAAALGWVRAPFAGYGASAAGTIFLHRWLGTGAAALALLAAGASERDNLRSRRGRLFQAILFAGILCTGLAAHLGGTLVYGENYFNW